MYRIVSGLVSCGSERRIVERFGGGACPAEEQSGLDKKVT